MVSFIHEALVAIVREHPTALLELLRAGFGVEHEGALEVVASPENLTVLQPAERRADIVLVLRDTSTGYARTAFVVEVQLRPDPRKRMSWPVYVSAARARLRCPVNLVVFALDAETAEWCAAPITLDDQGSVLRPRVLGPATVPVLDEPSIRRHPEIAVISLLAHRAEPAALDMARVIVALCADLDPDRGTLYADIVLRSLDEVARRTLEAQMEIANYKPQNEAVIKFFKAVAEGRAKAREEGRAQGLEEARGEERRTTLARALITVLEARGIALTEEQRGRIAGCTDADVLARWLAGAATRSDAAEILAG